MDGRTLLDVLEGDPVKPDGIQLYSLDKLGDGSKLGAATRDSTQWHRFVWLKSGTAKAKIGDQNVKLYRPTLISVPPGYAFMLDAHGTGFSLKLSRRYMDRILGQLGDRAEPIQNHGHVIPIQILDRSKNRVSEILDQIALEYDGDHIYRSPALYGNATLLIVEMARLLSLRDNSASVVAPTKGQAVFEGFMALIDAHFLEHWKVSQYAAALSISERALRRICRAVMGASPTEILQQRMMDEAKRQLLIAEKTISEISYELGFSDPSHFTKYFAKRSGMSPSAYRAQRHGRDRRS